MTLMSSTRLNELRELLRQRSRGGRTASQPRTGSSPVAWPPASGLAGGEVSEWVAALSGSGTWELALATVQPLLPTDSRWLFIVGADELYPPACEQRGLNLSQVACVRSQDPAEALWALEQGLRSRGVDVVCGWVSKLSPTAFRRLKLAAEAGGARCLLLRGPEALRETSWADVRVLVTPQPALTWQQRRLQVEVLKLRNGFPGGVTQVELDDETGTVRVVSELVDSTLWPRAAGA